MRIWIVWSGYEVALLASWLPEQVAVDCCIDRSMWPWTSKWAGDILLRSKACIEHLTRCGVEAIIVPPLVESILKKQYQTILPIFELYVQQVVLPASRVGKIGVMSVHGTEGAMLLKQHLKDICGWYTCTEVQQTTKVFDTRFPSRTKDVAHRNLHLPYASTHSRMMRNLLKHDLRYFKDVDVDTLLPGDRGLMYWEKMIRHRLWSRMKYHGSAVLRKLLAQVCPVLEGWPSLSVTVHTTADCSTLLDNKKRKQLLDRWGKRELIIQRVVV